MSAFLISAFPAISLQCHFSSLFSHKVTCNMNSVSGSYVWSHDLCFTLIVRPSLCALDIFSLSLSRSHPISPSLSLSLPLSLPSSPFPCLSPLYLPLSLSPSLSPRREAGDAWCLLSVWNLRAVIWFHFAISFLVLLPSPVTLSVLSFSACWPFLLNFFQEMLQYFSLRDRLFFVWLLFSS